MKNILGLIYKAAATGFVALTTVLAVPAFAEEQVAVRVLLGGMLDKQSDAEINKNIAANTVDANINFRQESHVVNLELNYKVRDSVYVTLGYQDLGDVTMSGDAQTGDVTALLDIINDGLADGSVPQGAHAYYFGVNCRHPLSNKWRLLVEGAITRWSTESDLDVLGEYLKYKNKDIGVLLGAGIGWQMQPEVMLELNYRWVPVDYFDYQILQVGVSWAF